MGDGPHGDEVTVSQAMYERFRDTADDVVDKYDATVIEVVGALIWLVFVMLMDAYLINEGRDDL